MRGGKAGSTSLDLPGLQSLHTVSEPVHRANPFPSARPL
jgi:hypothetical protein